MTDSITPPRRRRPPRHTALALALGLLAATAAPATHAADVEWLFRGSGFWDDAANWLEGAPPGPQDDVLVNFGSGNLPAIIRQRPGDAATSVYSVRSLTTEWPVQLLGGVISASGDLNFGLGLDWRGGIIGNPLLEPTGSARFGQGFQLSTDRLLGLNVRQADLFGASVIDTRSASAGASAGLLGSRSIRMVVHDSASLSLLGETPRLVLQGALDLRGQLTRAGGGGVAELWFADGSAISGQVRVNTGTLSLLYVGTDGPATHSGSFSAAAGTMLRITPGQVFTGSLAGAGTLHLSLLGNTTVRSAGLQWTGTLLMDPGAQLNLSGPGEAVVARLQTRGATLRPDDRLTVQQKVQADSLLVIQGAADSITTFAQGVQVATGLSVFSGNVVLGGGTTAFTGQQFLALPLGSWLRVAPGAVLQLDAGHQPDGTYGPAILGGLLQVQGTLARSAAASGPGLVQTQVLNSGLVDLAGGQLTLESTYTQTDTGTLRLRLTGDDDPRLVLQGAASFAGTLALDLADGFSLHAGQRVALLHWGAHSGSLTLDADSAALAPGLHLALEADAQALWLTASAVTGGGSGGISAPPAVPEPGTVALWLAGLAALGWRGVRRG